MRNMSPSRGLLASDLSRAFRIYQLCQWRSIANSVAVQSGHNRWSKIKEDKAKNDAAKNRQRSVLAHEIAQASKFFGPDPNSNPRLADIVTKAKKEGFAKTSIEAAIARGQGRSPSGISLENVVVEGMLNNVAVIVVCETESKARTLMDIRHIMKSHGGIATPSAYFFERVGRITFEKKPGIGVDEALDCALEAGAREIEEGEDGRLVVHVEPEQTKAVGEAMSQMLELQVYQAEILWIPKEETKVAIQSEEAARELSSFVDELEEREATVQAIAMNVAQGNLHQEAWRELQSRLIV